MSAAPAAIALTPPSLNEFLNADIAIPSAIIIEPICFIVSPNGARNAAITCFISAPSIPIIISVSACNPLAVDEMIDCSIILPYCAALSCASLSFSEYATISSVCFLNSERSSGSNSISAMSSSISSISPISSRMTSGLSDFLILVATLPISLSIFDIWFCAFWSLPMVSNINPLVLSFCLVS